MRSARLFRRPKKGEAGEQAKRPARRLRRVVIHPLFTIPTAMFMLLLLTAVVIVISGGTPKLQPSDSHIVIVNHDKTAQTVPTRAQTVGELLQKLQLRLNEGDVVEPSADTEIVQDNFHINIYRAVPVTIVDGGQKTFAYSAAATPRSIVKQVGIDVYPEDELKLLPTDNFLSEGSIGERVVISRATPLNINLYGTQVTMRSHAQTVKELLEERNIRLGPNDSIQPLTATKLTAGLQIFFDSQRHATDYRNAGYPYAS